MNVTTHEFVARGLLAVLGGDRIDREFQHKNHGDDSQATRDTSTDRLQTGYSLLERDVERKPCARYKLVSERNSGFLAVKQRQMKPLALGLRALKSF